MRSAALPMTLLIALLAAGWPVAAHAQAPESVEPDPELTTEVFRPRRAPLAPAWMLLSLPEQVVRTVLVPVALAVTLVERYRLDRRTYDLLRNDAGTIVVTPDLKLSAEGFGVGATISFKRVGDAALDLGAIGRIDGDWALEAVYERDLVFAEGRTLTLAALAELDQNLRYYGIGSQTASDDKRVIQSEVVEAVTALDVSGRGVLDVTGIVELAYRREGLSPGTDSSVPPIGQPGDMVAPPPDLGRDLDYGRFRAGLRYDTRDTEGRPTRGVAVGIAGSMVQELSGASFSAFGASAGLDWYVPVLPDHRVFIARAGVSMTAPFRAGHDIPLHALTVLGRKQHLRGYSSDRFHDRHGWWASAAYRFPIYEYINTGVALDAELFVETGHVASSLQNLVEVPIAHDTGIALRAGYDAANFFELELGVSPEGPVLGFSVGKSL